MMNSLQIESGHTRPFIHTPNLQNNYTIANNDAIIFTQKYNVGSASTRGQLDTIHAILGIATMML